MTCPNVSFIQRFHNIIIGNNYYYSCETSYGNPQLIIAEGQQEEMGTWITTFVSLIITYVVTDTVMKPWKMTYN